MSRKIFLSILSMGAIISMFCGACLAQEGASGAISSVRISPDMRQVVVRADGVLGKHTAFAFEKPYRLVVDFDSTTLGRISNKIKLDRPPIGEIRLGKLENRARLVIDFGDYPVPAYAIERHENMAVIALGETTMPKTERQVENLQETEKKQPKRPIVNSQPAPLKKEPKRTVEPVPAPTPIRNPVASSQPKPTRETGPKEHVVKKVLLSNDLLLVELADPQNPALSYHLALDIDMKDHTLRGASISGLNGEVKRFEISEVPDDHPVAENKAQLPGSTATTGPRKSGQSNTVFDSRPMEKPRNVFNTMPSVTSIQPPEAHAIQNPLKMEEFKLQVRGDH